MFLIYLNLSGGYLFEHHIFHFGEIYPEMCASVDLLSNHFLLKLIKHVYFGISSCSSFMITMLYVLLAGMFYHTYFCQKNSCWHNVIAIFQYVLFHLLGTQ